ncbi:hypothetical protein CsSME_00000778 [Camellia sinensis var. sinensis]
MKQFAWDGCCGGGNVGGASPEQAPPLPRDFPPPKLPPRYNYVPSAPPLVVVGGSDGYHCRGGIDGHSGGCDIGDSDGHCRRGSDGGSGGRGNSRSDGYRHHNSTNGRSGGYGGGRNMVLNIGRYATYRPIRIGKMGCRNGYRLVYR